MMQPAVQELSRSLIAGSLYDTFIHIRPVRRDGDAGLLRARSAQPVVHPCFCRSLCPGLGLRVFARRVAVWVGGSRLGCGRGAAVGEDGFKVVMHAAKSFGRDDKLLAKSANRYSRRNSSSILGSIFPPLRIATFNFVRGCWSRWNRKPATATAPLGSATVPGFAASSLTA